MPDTEKPQRQHKRVNVGTEEIKDFLTRTGFIFEMRVNEFLQKQGYSPEINSLFYDLEGQQSREIDIVAQKTIWRNHCMACHRVQTERHR